MQEIDITEELQSFRAILRESWPFLSPLVQKDKTGSFLEDWMQANWEMVVECSIPPELGVVLEIYGEGADCTTTSRVWKPDAMPTHRVFCETSGDTKINDVLMDMEVTGPVIFDSFCTIKDGWKDISPPFDYAEIHGEEIRVIKVDKLRFVARQLR